jgi:hypothetical protein
MLSRNPVIAFHGQQGSGKTHLTRYTEKLLLDRYFAVVNYGIKKTFEHLSLPIAESLDLDIAGKDLLAYKELQKAISCWGEQHVNANIWSDRYYIEVMLNLYNHAVISEDIRTPMNLNALIRMAEEGRQVFLFQLQASEEVRRERCDAWRENAGYTEKPLVRPEWLPAGLVWQTVNTELPAGHSYATVRAVLDFTSE